MDTPSANTIIVRGNIYTRLFSCNVKNMKHASPDPNNPDRAPTFLISLDEVTMQHTPPMIKKGPDTDPNSPKRLALNRNLDNIHRPKVTNRSM